MIKNTLPSKSENPENLKKKNISAGNVLMVGVLQVVLFTISCFEGSVKKHWVAKILQGIWERFLYENNRNYNSCKFSYKFTVIPFLTSNRNQKQESNFQQIGGLATRNSLAFFIASRALLQSYAKFKLTSIKEFSCMLFLLV